MMKNIHVNKHNIHALLVVRMHIIIKYHNISTHRYTAHAYRFKRLLNLPAKHKCTRVCHKK